MKRIGRNVAFALALARVLPTCGSSSNSGPGSLGNPGFAADAATVSDVGAASSPDDTGLPVEMHQSVSFQTPQAGGRYVYVADPSGDLVAVIDSSTLAIQTVGAGAAPTYLATVPGHDLAVVVNVRSSTATILRTADGGTTTDTLPLAPGATALAVSPDGHHVVAWQDYSAPDAGIATGSFQDLTVLTLDPAGDTSIHMTVGFMPRAVSFSADGASAYIVTSDGVSVLHFADVTGPAIVPNVPLGGPIIPGSTQGSDGGTDTGPALVDASADAAMDSGSDAGGVVQAPTVPTGVPITPDGRYALAWFQGYGTVRMVDLSTRVSSALQMPGVVTDLELSPDGSLAVAMVRERSEAVVIPVPQGFGDPRLLRTISVPGQIVGSVAISPVGSSALLFTSAVSVPDVTLADLTGVNPPTVIPVHKGIRAVAYAPDGMSALVVHTHATGDPNEVGIPIDTQIDRSFGYSLVQPSALFSRLQLTPAEVGPFALMPGGDEGFVLLRDDLSGVAEVQRVSMRSFEVQSLPLGSPPVSVGAVPATSRAFVGQDHPEGRITFIDWSTGALQTVTGFELNARIVQ